MLFHFHSQLHQNDVEFSPAFANILKEPLIIQQQTITCKKALNLSFLMLKGHRSGTFEAGPCPLAVKSIFILCHFVICAVIKMEAAQ